jgi:hypothetical protein
MRRWLMVRALATLAVGLFTAGAWGPWLALTFTFD